MNRTFLGAIALVALLGAAGAWWYFRADPYRGSYGVRELATWGLGSHLAQAVPRERVLVFSNPFTQRPGTAHEIVATEEAGLRGLNRGLGTPVAAVVLPELKAEALENPRALLADRECTTPLSFLVTPETFDKACKAHADCPLVVSLIGLPADLARFESWQHAGAPRFALLLPDLPLLGGTEAVARALQSGKLVAFVLPKPGAPGVDAPMGRDWEREFARRFVLVTPANFEEVRRTHPGLFPRR